MKTQLFVSIFTAMALATGCGPAEEEGGLPTPEPIPTSDNPNEAQSVKDARAQFPRFMDLQVNVLSSTCSPNPGVCHNSSNYPNLETAGNTIAYVSAPCNVEIPDPLQGWDNCERKADVMRAGAFVTEIAWMEHVGPGTWRVGFREPADATGLRKFDVVESGGSPKFASPVEWQVNVDLVTGGTAANLTVGVADDFLKDYIDSALKQTIGGDPNQNGVWGGANGAQNGSIFYPGDPAKSYLWGRLTGTVPGMRMPLANAPLTNPAYVALACWIEGLDDTLGAGDTPEAEDVIDYNGCAFADAPVDYAIE